MKIDKKPIEQETQEATGAGGGGSTGAFEGPFMKQRETTEQLVNVTRKSPLDRVYSKLVDIDIDEEGLEELCMQYGVDIIYDRDGSDRIDYLTTLGNLTDYFVNNRDDYEYFIKGVEQETNEESVNKTNQIQEQLVNVVRKEKKLSTIPRSGNIDIINHFFDIRIHPKIQNWGTNNLKIVTYDNGYGLTNYNTILAWRTNNGEYYINTNKYSSTTSKLQTYIRIVASKDENRIIHYVNEQELYDIAGVENRTGYYPHKYKMSEGLENTYNKDNGMVLTNKDLETEMDEGTDIGSVGAGGHGSGFAYINPYGTWAKNEKSMRNGKKTMYPGGSFVTVKKKCQKFPYCNQGDINALNLSNPKNLAGNYTKGKSNVNMSKPISEGLDKNYKIIKINGFDYYYNLSNYKLYSDFNGINEIDIYKQLTPNERHQYNDQIRFPRPDLDELGNKKISEGLVNVTKKRYDVVVDVMYDDGIEPKNVYNEKILGVQYNYIELSRHLQIFVRDVTDNFEVFKLGKEDEEINDDPGYIIYITIFEPGIPQPRTNFTSYPYGFIDEDAAIIEGERISEKIRKLTNNDDIYIKENKIMGTAIKLKEYEKQLFKYILKEGQYGSFFDPGSRDTIYGDEKNEPTYEKDLGFATEKDYPLDEVDTEVETITATPKQIAIELRNKIGIFPPRRKDI